tara:strand:- start:237 stop:659 length:423 start_codon:yes stop_codon:yes gene_type:complete
MVKKHELIIHKKKHYAEVIRSSLKSKSTVFFSPEKSSFQFGLLAHKKGYKEKPHYHRPFKRTIKDLQQMFVVQKGKVRVDLYSDSKNLIRRIILKKGDAIVLIHGIHSIVVLEDMQCISVKQGPFLGAEFDQVEVKVKQK